jgi:hypothetical protein
VTVSLLLLGIFCLPLAGLLLLALVEWPDHSNCTYYDDLGQEITMEEYRTGKRGGG